MSPPASSRITAPILPNTSLFARMRADGERSVFIVEADAGLRRIMTDALHQAGYHVLSAEDGDQAFTLLSRLAVDRKPLDLMLLDLHLPGSSGLDLLDRMRQVGMVLPTIAITDDPERNTVIEFMRRGGGDLIDKPVQVDHLVTLVRAFIERTDQLAARRRAREAKLKAEMEELDRARRSTERKAQEASDSYSRLEAQVQSARTTWQGLTGSLIAPPGFGLAWRNQPLADLGGDFIGLHDTPTGCIMLVADVAGHDMGASLYGVLIKAFFEENCRTALSSVEFMRQLNRQLIQANQQRRLVTAQLLDLNLATHQVTVISAGHPAILHQRGSLISEIASSGGVLGISDDVTLHPVTLPCAEGDRFFVCTDGVTDLARIDGPSGQRERLGLSGLLAALRAESTRPMDQQIEATWQALTAFCRRKPSDDMLLVGLTIDHDDAEYAPADQSGDTPSAIRKASAHIAVLVPERTPTHVPD